MTYLSAGVLAPTLETIIGIFWSMPPLTLNPNRPCSSGKILMITRLFCSSLESLFLFDPLPLTDTMGEEVTMVAAVAPADAPVGGTPAAAGPMGNLREMGVSFILALLEFNDPEP